MRKERKYIAIGIYAGSICPKSGQNTESVSQYTVSRHQKTNDFNANSRPCTGSVRAENQPSSERIAPSAVQTP